MGNSLFDAAESNKAISLEQVPMAMPLPPPKNSLVLAQRGRDPVFR